MFRNKCFSLCINCDDFLKVMEEFSSLCLNTEAKIDFYMKTNKSEGKVILSNVIEYTKDYNLRIDNSVTILHIPKIKEEMDIEIDDVKPVIARFVKLPYSLYFKTNPYLITVC